MTKLTIKDIARLSGVGKSTVSRVLNNDSKVSEATRQRVQNVIAQYSFQPSKSARAMRGVSDRVIGIIVTRLASTAENQVLSSILPSLYAQQCEPIIVESQFKPELVKEHLAFFQKRGVDGVILFAFSELEETDLQGWRHNMVVIARNYTQLSSIYYDDRKAVHLLMTHLYKEGHRKISYLGVNDQDATTGYTRHQAYLHFCKEYGLQPCSLQGELGYEWAYNHTSAVIFPEVSALVCATDTLAIGALKYLQEKQLSHIQVCGVGKSRLLHFLFPNVLSVDLGFDQVGEITVKQLFDLLENQSIQHHCLDCRLVI
ncbi:TPA: HTH-type transcriptional regulator TreR [Pasteurella multocida]|uniref:Trehalose operon repressor TreR n=1 Tax=Pasteurella multocida TaxID=747 RepID=A0A9X3UTE1_PASMD|nr:trehalose operon repressor TreR [Pasteurella multocida]AWW60138.1 HTH-type transcriptional regulator TreR [Pasteurellaceae bacterium 12591]AET16211.1 HTH-type transcriptional regulator TreR [Pasteurella multocida 36950]AHE64710.1 HTH-type transcriptional regulator TreR [Pasteurella multocida subsp. multocida str. HB03]AIN48520.1 trehalose operon repressor [Pasteurella multocida]ANJ90466.1 HTH-type transcriptional regulator TreR [Pasteurella multocida subsp. multocida HB01]